jgi:hypothetical protein
VTVVPSDVCGRTTGRAQSPSLFLGALLFIRDLCITYISEVARFLRVTVFNWNQSYGVGSPSFGLPVQSQFQYM